MKRGKNMQSILKRLFPSAPSEEMESAGDRVLNRLRAEAPECIEAFRFRPHSGAKTQPVRPADRLVLTAVHLLRGDGHSLSITNKAEELSSKEWNLGAVYVSLDRLESQGLISSEERQSGGRTKRFFKLTERGERVLAEAAPAQ